MKQLLKILFIPIVFTCLSNLPSCTKAYSSTDDFVLTSGHSSTKDIDLESKYSSFDTTILNVKINKTGKTFFINAPGRPGTVYVNKPPGGIVYKDLYVISGQSNASGQACFTGLVGDNLYLRDSISISGFKARIRNYVTNANEWQTIWTGRNTSESFCLFGIQPKLFHQLVTYRQKDYWCLQMAVGAKAINNWDNGDPYMEYIIDQWNEFQTTATAEGKTARLRAFIWIQGESDRLNYGTYQASLESLISRVRSRTGQSTMPFLIGQAITPTTCAGTVATLQSIQATVATQPYNYLIPYVSGDTTLADSCHYSIDSYNRKADQIFNIIKDF